MSTDEDRIAKKLAAAFNSIVDAAHTASVQAGWWDAHLDSQSRVQIADGNIVPTKLCLIHSEISEAMEGHRKGLPDDKLPHRSMIEVELADAVIRIADLAGALGLDVGGAIAEKMAFNRVRPDHKRENRAKPGGKVY